MQYGLYMLNLEKTESERECKDFEFRMALRNGEKGLQE